MDQPAEEPADYQLTPAGRIYVSPPHGPSPAAAGDPWAAFPDAPPAAKGSAKVSPSAQPAPPVSGEADPWAAFSDHPPQASAPSREVGAGEAAGRGLVHGITMGLSPAIEGASAAANPDIEAAAKKFGIDPATAKSLIDHLAPTLKTMYGAGRVIADNATGQSETPAQNAYGTKRAEEAQANAEAREQHPYLYTGADIAGSLAVPLPGLGAVKTAAPLVERVGRGVAEGMIGGGAFGAGNAIGEGKDASETLGDAANGVAVGGVLGGAIGGVAGRRPGPTGATSAQRATATADQLGAPLPRGVASDSPMVRATAAKLKEFPFAGERIAEGVHNTQQAAGREVNEMASNLAGGAPTRTTAAPSAEPALRQVVEHNNTEIDRAYNALRGAINPDQHFPMTNLRRALQQIRLRRARAGWPNPGEGLQQAENVANNLGHAGGFNGVHRLRRDLREAGNPTKANPGYDAGDFRFLRRAVDADLRAGVRHVSVDPNRAESLFNTAELEAGHLIDMNEGLEKLANQKGEGIVGALINAAKEKSGNIQLLREVRGRMDPATFNQLSGVLLHELGLAEGQVGEFSLARFATNWNKMSDQAKALMYSPQHRAAIENIVNLGNHLKSAGKYDNNSHTGSIIVLMDVAKDAALLWHDVASSGNVGLGTLVGAGTTAGTFMLTRWLGNPATAQSMSRWTDAYRAITLHQPTPARVAAFKVATRNLANNINIPAERIMEAVSSHSAAAAESEPHEKQLDDDEAPRE